ncbi:MAG: hypothetical protein H8E66_04375 [Planctomycetes bacterium]|nr:hypothetical protein [Planctomycetota bacterium]
MPKPPVDCIYCGFHKPGSREHVVQDALGGVDVLENVCEECNRLLARIDKVLAVQSPLSLCARRELSCFGPNSWDVDESRDGLLLDAKPTPRSDSMTSFPQLIFDGDEQLFYCDAEDFERLGKEEAEDRFYTRLRRAFGHYKLHGPHARKRDHKGMDMLKHGPVESIRTGYRLPPRICCAQSLVEFDSKAIMFDLRYLADTDRDRVLATLSKIDWSNRSKKTGVQLGSRTPVVHFGFCVTHAIRALTKIGVNLLAFFCKSTPVNRNTFRQTIEWVLVGMHDREFGDVQQYGFVAPTDVAELSCPARSHKFRLTHDLSTNTWKLYASFFGGQAAAHVAFRGPNRETWATMDVVVPYDQPMPAPTFDNWYRPLDTRTVIDAREVLPSIPWTAGEVRVRQELVARDPLPRE